MPHGKPIEPRNKKNPVGQVTKIKKAMAAVRRQLRAVRKLLKAKITGWNYKIVTINTAMAGNVKIYQYQLSAYELENITAEILSALQANDASNAVIKQALAAYEDGTGQSVTNLLNLTEDYTRNITQVLSSAPYQRRSALIASRVFEEMEIFNGTVGKDLARVLRDAVEIGKNPLDIVKSMVDQFEITAHRAERIARTEITGALRRARLDESQDAQERLGIRSGMKHFSAASATTRDSHYARHGKIYTVQAVREWYSITPNGINCKCSQVEVLLDEDRERIE